MPQVRANGLNLEYEIFGDAKAEPLVLIMGLGAQMILWPDDFCHRLADAGYHVFRYDNRDVGLSTKYEEGGKPRLMRAGIAHTLGMKVTAPYTLHEMAQDALGFLDALKIRNAHIVGASMGGMIAQILSAKHPKRVKTLTLIMSSTNNPRLPGPSLKIRMRLVKRPEHIDRESIINHSMQTWRLIGSPDYPADDKSLRTKIERSYDRCAYPRGIARQTMAIMATGSLVPLLKSVAAPTRIIHGADDPLVPIAHAHDIAKHISGSELITIPGMGHDLPVELVPTLARLVIDHVGATRAVDAPKRRQA